MERSVSARLAFKTNANTKVAMAIAVARNSGYSSFEESLSVMAGGEEVPLTEISDHHGGLVKAVEVQFPGASWQRCLLSPVSSVNWGAAAR